MLFDERNLTVFADVFARISSPRVVLGTPSVMSSSNVGLLEKTSEPVPVSSVTAAARLALEGVPRNVATPLPRPLTPVLIGRPVPLVSVIADGVPRSGVTSVGLVANTSAPVPVSSVKAERRLADDGVASHVPTPAPRPVRLEAGKFVQFDRSPEAGVPSTGVTSTGEVASTMSPEPVDVLPSAVTVPLVGNVRLVAPENVNVVA